MRINNLEGKIMIFRRFLFGLVLVASIFAVSIGAESNIVSAQTQSPFRVYLTFEDGPTRVYTPELLDILASYNAKATFFPNGYQIPGKEDIINRIIREGHAIGNHLWEEPGYYSGTPDERVIASYLRAEDALRSALEPDALAIYDAQPKLFRQPGGGAQPFPANDNIHVITYNWNVQSDDCGWALDPNSDLSMDEQVLENVLNIPRSIGERYNVYDHGDGAVIVFHDINRVTARVLPVILDELSSAGATFPALPRPSDVMDTMPLALAYPPAQTMGIEGVLMRGELRDHAWVRAEPNTSASLVITSLSPQTNVMVTGRTGEELPLWFRVEYDGTVGWMHRSTVRVIGPIPNLPIVTF